MWAFETALVIACLALAVVVIKALIDDDDDNDDYGTMNGYA